MAGYKCAERKNAMRTALAGGKRLQPGSWRIRSSPANNARSAHSGQLKDPKSLNYRDISGTDR